jgi:hypothetical protein
MLAVSSRYYGLDTENYVTPDGRTIVYLTRRFLPPAGTSPVIAIHTVTQGERLDNITARYLGDPEQFWRICDMNNAVHPDEMTAEIDRNLNIPFPQGGSI